MTPPTKPGLAESGLPYPVVGIGASAGGIAALTRFFEQVGDAPGMAFVVVLHLSPTHESNVAAILQRATTLTVMQVTGRTAIAADHVYVIPPNKDLNMDDGHLTLRDPTRERGPHVAVDLFLRTLAEAHTDRAFAIILSGLGSDGAVGVQRINECGGVTIAQRPSDAEFDSMPRAAIATGLVDLVLPVGEIPGRLQALWQNVQRIRLPADASLQRPTRSPVSDDEKAATEKALKETLALLHKRTRHDFQHYKRATVLRRLERRLQVNAVPDLATYRDYLDKHPAETSALLQDMLISVTSFFRDQEAFAALEKTVIPALFAGRTGNDVVRIWIAACATGEEAYALAILMREYVETLEDPAQIQIFATDIDERAIAIGRAGVYSEGIANDVTPNRLRRFFHKEGDRYRVVKSVRESILFAVHNVLRDPPFSRVDLITCRNLLIYLDSEAQKNILDMFRFAMQPSGFLFLGTSESTDAAADAFELTDKKHRIYQVDASAPTPRIRGAIATIAAHAERHPGGSIERKRLSHVELHRHALEQYALPSVLIDSRSQILHMSAGAGDFFIRAKGTPTHDLLANTHPELRAEMTTAVFRAQQQKQPVSMRASWGAGDGARQRVTIHVRPFHDDEQAADFSLITLQRHVDGVQLAEATSIDAKAAVQQLEYENSQLKGYLQETVERSETYTQDLKASNEELQAINEELRSASEELETSKEELQSINEELTTVNYELKTKIEETIQINDDMRNLIESTDIAVVFVDSHLRVKRFTPKATQLFNLIPGDIGRSLLDITHRLDEEFVARDAQDAFSHLRVTERETRSEDGRHFLARVVPYRTLDNKIEGAVMTFVDITSRVMAERRIAEGEERLRIAAATVRHFAIVTLDEAGVIVNWNAGAQVTFGYTEQEVIGQHYALLFTAEDRAQRIPETELETARVHGAAEDDRWHLHKNGMRFYASGVTTSYRSGETAGFAKIARDLTGSKLLETRRDEELSREKQSNLAAEAANRTKDEFLAVMSHELKHPLNLIHVNAELLTRMPEVAQLPAVRRAAETIRRTVVGQGRIIDDLLDLSRARTGKMTLTVQETSLRDIVVRVGDAARQDADGKKVRFAREVDPADAITIACDPVRVEQIVWNLLSNAIKFTDSGGLVTLRLSRRRDEGVLEVIDTGRGIEPSFIANVFSMFRQERRQVIDGEGGMGIGLALVKELAEAQGGRVAVTSPGVGQGATFLVAFPVAATADGPASPSASGAGASVEGLRILAVDDSAEALEPFAELLRLEGADVVEAHSGPGALDALRDQSFDLLVSDVGMPGMDGYQLINEVRQSQGPQLVAIAVSGYGRQGDVERATEVGFDAHLTKPASVDDLKQMVGRLRERGRLK